MFVFLLILLLLSGLFYGSMYYVSYAYAKYNFDDSEINRDKSNLQISIIATTVAFIMVVLFNFIVALNNNWHLKLGFLLASLGSYLFLSIIIFIVGGIKNKLIHKEFQRRPLTIEDILEEQNKAIKNKIRKSSSTSDPAMLPIYLMTSLAISNSTDSSCNNDFYDGGSSSDCSVS